MNWEGAHVSRRNRANRREVIIAGATVASLAALGPGQALAVPFAGRQNEVPLALQVNGVRHDLNLEPRVTLLDTRRERLNLCGTKKGCDIGQCGAPGGTLRGGGR
jgi:xanthine dehydrogenase YagT iron-sulfur-binding subunit